MCKSKFNTALFLMFLLFGFLKPVSGQTLSVLSELSNELDESSGLIILNDKIVSHNDSEGEAILYELDSISGNVTTSVQLNKANNIDWEDLCFDETYIYIGDIGNNNGTRKDLKIYRLLKSEYLEADSEILRLDSILFSYEDQTEFTEAAYATNFDAEALISYGDSLYIFSKNWLDNRTNVYSLAKSPGTYIAKKVDSFDSQGLISGAYYDTTSNSLLLSGYTLFGAFIINITDFTGSQFSSGTINQYSLDLPIEFSYQVEGITTMGNGNVLLSSEKNELGKAGLFKFGLDQLVQSPLIQNEICKIYPNPVSDFLNVEAPSGTITQIINVSGMVVRSSNQNKVDISGLNKGQYVVRLMNERGRPVLTQKVIVD